jgi:hypothetical protein
MGDGWWSARLHRDEGVAPTGKCLFFAHAGDALHFVGAPPPGRWVVVCEASSRRGRRSHKTTKTNQTENNRDLTPINSASALVISRNVLFETRQNLVSVKRVLDVLIVQQKP